MVNLNTLSPARYRIFLNENLKRLGLDSQSKLELSGIIFRLMVVFATLVVLMSFHGEFIFFNNQYIITKEILLLKMISILIIIVVFVFLYDNFENDQNLSLELLVMSLISLIGMFIMISANDLLILTIGLELQTIPYFIFCCLGHNFWTSSTYCPKNAVNAQ